MLWMRQIVKPVKHEYLAQVHHPGTRVQVSSRYIPIQKVVSVPRWSMMWFCSKKDFFQNQKSPTMTLNIATTRLFFFSSSFSRPAGQSTVKYYCTEFLIQGSVYLEKKLSISSPWIPQRIQQKGRFSAWRRYASSGQRVLILQRLLRPKAEKGNQKQAKNDLWQQKEWTIGIWQPAKQMRGI